MNSPSELRVAGLVRDLLVARRGLVWLLLLFAAAAGLQLVPQLDLLNYYFALATSLVVGPAGLHVGLAAGRLLRGRPARDTGRVAAAAVVGALLLGLVPLAVVTVAALWTRNCDYVGGLLFYGMGPLAGGVYAAIWGLVLGSGVGRAWLRRLLVTALVVVAVGLPVVWFYALPVIHQYHPVLGYFSGAVYDELIRVSPTFVAYRATNLLEAAVLVLALRLCRSPDGTGWCLPWRGGGARHRVAFLGVGLVAAGVAALFPATLGYRYGRDAIRAQLGGHLATEHFDIYFPGRQPYARVVPRVAAEHERCYARITEALGTEPNGRLASYIYPDGATKRRLIGADRVYIAKPWLGEIHLNRVEAGADVICHELVHALAAPCASGPLGVPVRFGVVPHMGVVEGLAVALTGRPSRFSLHEASAAMRRLGLAPDMRRLMGAEGFWTAPAGQAYVTAGSFIRFLTERYGQAPLCDLYRNADFTVAYGAGAEALIARWEAFLDDPELHPLDEEGLRLVEDVFDRPSVFQKVCALEVAAVENEAWTATRQRRFDDAVALRERVVGFDPGNPAKRIALAYALLRAGDVAAARAHFGEVSQDTAGTRMLRLRARVGIVDCLWLDGDSSAAAPQYEELAREPMDDGLRRSLHVKAIAADGPPDRSDLVRDYLLLPLLPGQADARLTAFAETHPGDVLVRYLLGRLRMHQGRFAGARRELGAALSLGRLPRSVHREAVRLSGLTAFVLDDMPAARRWIDKALAATTHSGERAALERWQDRVAWRQAHPLPRWPQARSLPDGARP